MCDIEAGSILVGGPSGSEVSNLFMDFLIDLGRVGPLSHDRSLRAVVEGMELETGAVADRIRAHRFAVPAGLEHDAVSGLHRTYVDWMVDHADWGLRAPAEQRLIWIQPNHVLTGSATAASAPKHLEPSAEGALAAAGLVPPAGEPAQRPARVVVLDSGISAPPGVPVPPVELERNWVEPDDRDRAPDRLGHGTAVAACIAAVDPTITIDAFKVLSDGNRATEWDVLAALGTRRVDEADVVNLSLAFGLQDEDCGACGQRHHSSLSQLFQGALSVLHGHGQVVVAAAGNHPASGELDDPSHNLAFPARFDGVVAVGALDASDRRLATSNLRTPPTMGPDERLVFAPGRAPVDLVSDGGRTPVEATSFATGYVSAVVAALRARGRSAPDAVRELVGAAERFADHCCRGHCGAGRVTWPGTLRW